MHLTMRLRFKTGKSSIGTYNMHVSRRQVHVSLKYVQGFPRCRGTAGQLYAAKRGRQQGGV